MKGCGTNKWDPVWIDNVLMHVFVDGDYVDYINSWFDSETASALLQGISLNPNNPGSGIKSEEEVVSFLMGLSEEPISNLSVDEGNTPKYENEDTTQDLSVFADYIATSENGRVEYDRLINSFGDEVFDRAILKNGHLLNPNDVNKNLLEYKLDLLRQLRQYLNGKDDVPENFKDDLSFDRFVKSTLSAYHDKINGAEFKDYENVHDAYIKLAHFDTLLEQFAGFINKKKAYTKSIGLEMYESMTPFDYKDKYTTYREDAGTEDYSSDFVKLLLRHLKKADGTPIGFEGFTAVSGKFLEWAENSRSKTVQDAIYNGVDRMLVTESERKSGEKWIDGKTNMHNIYGLEYALDEFIKSPSSRSMLKSEAEAIRDVIFGSQSNLDKDIRRILANQFITSVRYSYVAYRMRLDGSSGEPSLRFIDELLQSELVNKQIYSLQSIIKNRVLTLRENPSLYSELLEKYHITVDTQKQKITVNDKDNYQGNIDFLDPRWKAIHGSQSYIINITRPASGSNTRGYKFEQDVVASPLMANMFSEEFIKNFIQDVTGLTLPSDWKQVWDASNPNGVGTTAQQLWNAFSKLAWVTLTASVPNNPFDLYKFRYGGQELQLYDYYNYFVPAANFYSVAYGAEATTVLKNGKGNNLPTSQLRTSIFDVKQEIWQAINGKTQTRSNTRVFNPTTGNWESGAVGKDAASGNILVKNANNNPIGLICVRGDTKVDDRTKASQELTPQEVLHQAIVNDFFFHVDGMHNSLRKSSNPTKENLMEDSVLIQPITYSDKRTHFLVEFNLKALKLSAGDDLKSIIAKIMSFDKNRRDAILKIEKEIKDTRADRIKTTIVNFIQRYNTGLNLGMNVDQNADYITLKKQLDVIQNAIQHLSESELIKAFATLDENGNKTGEMKADIYHELDYIKKNNELLINPTMLSQFESYLSFNSDLFKSRIDEQKFRFIRDLISVGFELDPLSNPSLRERFKTMQIANPEWFDAIDGSMKLWRTFDKDGNEKQISWYDLDNLRLDQFSRIEYNPILESYFYTDILLSGAFNDLIFGDVSGYKGKTALNPGDNYFLMEDESSRLSNMAKRTVSAGASRITFAQGMKYGVPSTVKIAVFDDPKAPVFNFLGSYKNLDGQDGSAHTSPLFARMQNNSLLDRKTGNEKKKTFWNWRDSETGTAGELKFAEYTTTNEFRRKSPILSECSSETMFRKMHSINDEKISRINLSKYYGEKSHTNEDGDNITFTKSVYRWNTETLKYERLLNISTDSLGFTTLTWGIVNNDNTSILKEYEEPKRKLKTIYDLDNVFGGAWCCEWSDEYKKFIWSDANNDIVTTIVCEENLKNDFIPLAANYSANKTGVRNLNPSNVFSIDNNDALTYMEVSTLHYGIQMNPDHDVEHGSVTEMSQMISSLVQSGLKTDQVNEIYEAIGLVALESVKQLDIAINDNDQTEIYRIVGEALVKAFDSGSKDVLGLAHSFVALANKGLASRNYNIRIPYSANTIKSSFQSTITSLLNKEAIRRKYAGLGGIQTPSYGMIQYFEYNDKKLSWPEFIKVLGSESKAIAALTDSSINPDTGEPNNPFIKKANRNKLRLGDYVLVKGENNTWLTNKPIKLNTPDVLDEYKHLNTSGEIYIWKSQPKDLGGSTPMFTALGETWTVWDLDSVRSLIYIRQMSNGDFKNMEIAKIILSNVFPDLEVDNIDWTSKETYSELEARLKWKIIKNDMPLLDDIASGKSNTIPGQISMGLDRNTAVAVDSVQLSPVEIGIGKLSASKLGLEPGDTLNDVKRLKERFFERKLRYLKYRPSMISVSQDMYDIALHGSDKSQTLVLFGGINENKERLKKTISNPDYKWIQGHWWKNDVDYGSAATKTFRQYLGSDGKTYDVVVIDSWEDYDELMSTNQYINGILNFTEDNWQDLFVRKYRHSFNNEGKLINPIEIDGFIVSGNANNLEVDSDDIATLVYVLNKAEDATQDRIINNKAKQKYDAFNEQLKIIIDRIPSQSMQSCASADVVMLLDTNENAVIMSTFLMWIQGSDLDIDKGFMMAYELTEDGKIVTLSKLDRYYAASKVLELPLPNEKVFNFIERGEIPAGATVVTAIDLLGSEIELIAKILNGNTNVYWDRTTAEYDTKKRKIEERIRLHQNSLHSLPKSTREAGLRNTVVNKINKVLRSMSVQYNMDTPVDEAMDDLKAFIPEGNPYDRYGRTWDNPAVKYMLQYENMVGRTVIGIGAVSLKSFYGLTACFNNAVNNITNAVIAHKNGVENGNIIFRYIKDIVFDSKFGSTGIATLANVNFKNLKQQTSGLIIQISDNKVDNGQQSLKNYIINQDGNYYLDLGRLVEDLDLFANGTYRNPKDAAKVLSGIVSLATDNAKELALSKLNATAKYADIYTYLTSVGVPFGDIANFMTSKTFNLVSRYSQDSILDPSTARFNVDNSIAFILDQKTLPNINNYVFESILTDMTNVNKSFIYKLVYGIKPDGSVDLSQPRGQFVFDQLLKNIDVETRFNLIKTDGDQIVQLQRIVDNRKDEPQKYRQLINNIYELLEDTTIQQILLSTLAYNANNTEEAINYRNIDNEDVDEEQYFLSYGDMDYSEELDEVNNFYRTDAFFEYNQIQKDDYVKAYRYVRKYLIPKNNVVSMLKADPQTENYKQELQRLQEVIESSKEQQILGAIYGINQGMDTNDFEEYRYIKSIENFVNRKYIDKGKTNFKPFNFIEFLSNPEIQKLQIDQYNEIKSAYNVLQMSISVPHYRAMLDTIRMNRYLIERSIALRMERTLADQILKAGKKATGNFNYGFTQSLNNKEFGIIKKYVNDLLILKWLSYQPDLTIDVPENQKYYQNTDWTKPIENKQGNLGLAVDRVGLNTINGLATFKNLMDNYIVPRLKQLYPNEVFIQSLQPGSLRNKQLSKLARFYQLPFNIADADKNPALKLKYDEIATSFRRLMNQHLPEGLALEVDKANAWTIGDLFYIYNLIVGKDGFTAQGMTRLFEDMNNSGNEFALVRNYYQFLSNIDARSPGFDYRSLFAEELSGDRNALKNLRWRLSFMDNADYKFKVKQEFDYSGNLVGIRFIGEDGEESETFSVADINISDFTFDMPFKWSDKFKYNQSDALRFRAAQDYYLGSNVRVEHNKQQILTSIVDYLRSKLQVPVQVVTNAELDKMAEDKFGIKFDNQEDLERTKNSDAFIHNGTIYVNVTNASIDAPVHELLHIVFAAMKYDDRYKSLYYELLNKVATSEDPAIKNIFDRVKTKYQTKNGSDIKEEAFVEFLAEGFRGQFETNWNGIVNEQMKASDIARVTREILNTLLDTAIPENTDMNVITNISIRSILHNFGSDIFDIVNNEIAMNRLPMTEKLYEIKDRLIRQLSDNNKITFSNECI